MGDRKGEDLFEKYGCLLGTLGGQYSGSHPTTIPTCGPKPLPGRKLQLKAHVIHTSWNEEVRLIHVPSHPMAQRLRALPDFSMPAGRQFGDLTGDYPVIRLSQGARRAKILQSRHRPAPDSSASGRDASNFSRCGPHISPFFLPACGAGRSLEFARSSNRMSQINFSWSLRWEDN
ncbi:hypothetical protein BD311DRAFT_326843 [Dichomitus squalens]|uniref:Uncharacterized protein n=1 Tax=Dichomitus squalens TaxID=114155 RepID=A0A4Q9ML43_9APHY|nr:hypothetical protein BD311DRAFT_326843 [Dichomitus squalens]